MEARLNIFSTVYYIILFCGWSSVALSQADEELSLNGTWQFRIDPNNIGKSEEWFRANLNPEGWDKMEVPGNWDLHNEYAHYVGKGWYTKTFTLPPDWDAKTVILYFEAVYHDCAVWLNGKKLGENNTGFLPFEFEVADLLEPGQKNTLVVYADNTSKRGANWNWVFYKNIPYATACKARYGKDRLEKETVPSKDVFSDINDLELDQTYTIQIVAINSMGESLSDPREVIVNQRNYMPPALRYAEPQKGFFIFYASDETNFLYRIRYGEKNSEEKIIQSRAPGLTFPHFQEINPTPGIL